jgi:hypothetical protein
MNKLHLSTINYNCRLLFVSLCLLETVVISQQNAHPVLVVAQGRLTAIVLHAMKHAIH